jgi:ABC-2 type transport system permease protein
MNFANILKIARHEWRTAFRHRIIWAAAFILALAMLAALYVGWRNYQILNQERELYSRAVADRWVNQPDRHPHRVAHYGYLVFRPKAPLSFFDAGVDSYAGTTVFLEAHRQNTANFSEARHSSGILRFGELNLAMILQLLVPLLIFFLGFSAITAERENGTLQILFSQGVAWREILLGKTLGIVSIIFALLAPIIAVAVALWLVLSGGQISADSVWRVFALVLSYTAYFVVCAAAAVLISAFHRTSRGALVTLVVVWILFFVVVPRAAQSLGAHLFPTPAKSQFDRMLETEVAKHGDSHNPNDPKFADLKRETLAKYGVADVKDLPFNYGGFVMSKSEEISSEIFREHYAEVLEKFRQQNLVGEIAGLVNPFLAVRHFSMAMAASDLSNYENFQWQAEDYRYRMIQKLNEFHTQEIKFENDRAQKVSRERWDDFPPFEYQTPRITESLANQTLPLAALALWLALALGGLWFVKPKNTV